MNFFENYAILAMESDIGTFYAIEIIKVTSGFNLKQTIFFARWRQQLKYFSNTNNSTTLTLSGTPGVSREAKLFTEFEFDSLVR